MFGEKKEAPIKVHVKESVEEKEIKTREVFLTEAIDLLEKSALLLWSRTSFNKGDKAWSRADKLRGILWKTRREKGSEPGSRSGSKPGSKSGSKLKSKKRKGLCQLCGKQIPEDSGRWKYCSAACSENGKRIRAREYYYKNRKNKK